MLIFGDACIRLSKFNHLGNDLSRSLLKFSNKKPLGKNGFHWLKVHTANLFGFDKASFDERAKYVEDRIDDLIDSAENPLDGNQWWLEADNPWQALGAIRSLCNFEVWPKKQWRR